MSSKGEDERGSGVLIKLGNDRAKLETLNSIYTHTHIYIYIYNIHTRTYHACARGFP